MSLKIFGKEFSLLEFFDPKYNNLWSMYPTASITPPKLKEIYNEIFSKENYDRYFFAFNPDFRDYADNPTKYYASRKAKILEVVDQLPEEDRWTLMFLNVREGRNDLIQLSGIKESISVHDDYYTSMSFYEYTASQFTDDKILEALSKAKENFNECYKDRNKFFKEPYYFKTPSNFCINIFQYIVNMAIVKSGGTTKRPGQIHENPGNEVYFDCEESQIEIGKPFRIFSRVFASRENKTGIENLMEYSANPCNFMKWPIKEPNEVNPVIYGVELECCSDLTVKEIVHAQALPFFICKKDGSITGSKSGRYEMVTVPMSLKAHKRHWAAWFSKIDYKSFDVTTENTNGIHVHIDRKAFFNDKHVQNMCWFYNNPFNREFIIQVSERGNYKTMSQYSALVEPNGISKVRAYKSIISNTRALSKYSAVNLSKEKTIEIRIFKGIVSFAELMKNLEFVDAAFQFSSGEHSPDSLRFTKFIEWLNKRPTNQYTVLKEFISKIKNIESTVLEAEIRDMIADLKDPELIAQRVNDRIKNLSNVHVSILNKGSKRTYILNKEGFVEVTASNRSKLFSLDRDIEKRFTRNAV